MNPTHNASSALVQYLVSLLLDEGAPSNAGLLAENCEQHAEGDGKVVARDDADPNALRLLLFKAGEIPLAISQEIIAEVVEVKRSSLEPVASTNGMLVRQFKYNGQVVGILDARDIILPDGHPARQVKENDGNAYILMFKTAECGLMCDHAGDAVKLGHQDVEWRLQRSSRLWLAGMVKANKHALLDDKEILHIADRALSSLH
jgi:chemotaxis signal transduction protein